MKYCNELCKYEGAVPCDRNEVKRMILEMDALKTKLEAKLKDAGRYYDKLKDAYDTAVNELAVSEPKLDKSKRDADICHVAGNTSSVVGGILAGVGILATPLTAGASLGLTASGLGLIGAGGVVTVGATIGNSVVKSTTYSSAKEVLGAFVRCRSQLCKELDRVYEVSKIINEKRDIDKYKPVFEIMFPENTVQYKIVNQYYQNQDFLTKFNLLRGLDGASNILKGVYLFVNVMEDFSKQGTKVTERSVAKILIPLGVVIDTAFLYASISELCKDNKCKVADAVGLMKEAIEKEMENVDDIREKLCYFHLEETMKD